MALQGLTEFKGGRGDMSPQRLGKGDTVSLFLPIFCDENNVVVQISLPRYCQGICEVR